VSTLPNPVPAAGNPLGAYWAQCARCDELFETIPGQRLCRMCRPAVLPGRCQAAHRDDRSPCQGPHNAVRVLDRAGQARYGCVHHAAVAVASIAGARVRPGSQLGAAFEAYQRARTRRPFESAPGDRPPAAPGCSAGWGGR
jgi:hypothetical protein